MCWSFDFFVMILLLFEINFLYLFATVETVPFSLRSRFRLTLRYLLWRDIGILSELLNVNRLVLSMYKNKFVPDGDTR